MVRTPTANLRRAPRRGLTWLVVFLLIAGALAALILKPDLLRNAFTDPRAPNSLGDRPTSTSDISADTSTRDIVLDSRGLRSDAAGFAQTPNVSDRPPLTDTNTGHQVQVADDDTKAAPLFAEATKAYRGYQWSEVKRICERISRLKLSETMQARAEELVRNSQGLENLFVKLGVDKEELMRNINTHPSLVFIQYKGNADFYVPLRDFTGATIIESPDPAGALQAIATRTGKAPVMNTRRITAELEASHISLIKNADVAKNIAQARETFEQKMARLRASAELRVDAMAWYAAARFAYQNRLDELVVDLLEQAWIRDHDLATTIREDKASDIYLDMVRQLDNDNRTAAGAFMAKLRKQYQDTSVFAQAEAHYNGNLADLRRKQETAVAEKQRKREEAQKERLAQAKKTNDTQAVAEIQQEEQVYVQEQQQMTMATGDEGKADRAYAEAKKYFDQANGMVACPQRDTLYSQALPLFTEAVAIYSKLVQGGNDAVASKLQTANMYRYHCIKMKRPF